MARIPDSEIQRLKDEVSVQRLVEAAGIELKKIGKDFAGLCPFHREDTASFIVTPAKNLWRCFGCGAAGGPIDWVMRLKGVSFRHAVELLKDDAGMQAVATAGGGVVKSTTVRTLAAPVAFDADDRALLRQVADYYHQTLKQSPEALDYLTSRGLAHPELVEHFKLGYANRTLGLRLPNKQRAAGADIRARLERVGVYRASGHEHLAGSLIVPVLDEHGDVRELYGRKITPKLRPGTPLHLYLPASDERGRGVFNVQALMAHPEVIVCEALIDALTFWCAGYRNVTTAYGVEGFTDEMLAAFKRHGTKRALIAFDRDDAGERGAARLAEQLMAQGIDCWRIQFPRGMDANEYAQKVQPAAKSLGLLIRKALWLGQGKPPEPPEPSAQPQPPSPKPPASPSSQAKPSASAPADVPAGGAQDPVPPSAAENLPSEPPLPAQAVPDSAPPELPCEVKAHGAGSEVTFDVGDRRYRVRGLAKNLSFELLKVNVLVARAESFYVDTLDLYAARQRHSFIAHAALELQIREDILKADLGRVLLRLEALQEEAVTQTLERAPVGPQMSAAEHEAALELLRASDLVARILADFAACGLVGEKTNKLVGYLAAISRKLDKPLGVVVQSSSAAGKTTLMDAVLSFVPDEEKVKYSAMTGQSLFYMGETNLKHKALAIVEEEGASRASYALKLLQSEGELTIASTGKDPQSGNLITQQYRVEGPVALLFTTTARDLDEELMNRCLVLAVDEGREQTQAIHRLQRERRTLEGLLAKRERQALTALHQNAQRLLRPVDVLNPYAQQLTFPDQTTRLRRDHEKYLTLIDTIALLHQHQREVKTAQRGEQVIEYIEATLEDIALANAIAHEVLGRSLDELPPQTRRLLTLIDQYVRGECERLGLQRSALRFSRRTLREAIGWGDTQLRVHLERLVELEYVLAHREGAGGKFVYELVYEVGSEARAQLAGLIDVDALADTPTAQKSRGSDPEVAGRSRGDSGQLAGRLRPIEMAAEPASMRLGEEQSDGGDETRCSDANDKSTSYLQPLAAVLPSAGAAAAG